MNAEILVISLQIGFVGFERVCAQPLFYPTEIEEINDRAGQRTAGGAVGHCANDTIIAKMFETV
jgi:hypothetical protein